MLIKICGLKYPENIKALASYQIDMMGFIFYPKSLRFVGEELENSKLEKLPENISKVGVFVNEPLEELFAKQQKYQLDYIQLHGDENEAFCQRIKDKKIGVIKAFQIDEGFAFSALEKYQSLCDFFLFDTKTSGYGGSGKSFDWNILNRYQLNTPFLLSGGIGLENLEEVLSFKHPKLAGYDINSKIELAPGLKSTEIAESIVEKIKTTIF